MVHIHNQHFATRQSMSAGSRPAFWRPTSRRFAMSLMMCVAIIAETFVKNTLNMSVVCMVNSTALSMHHEDNPDFGPKSNETDCQVSRKIDKQYDGKLIWDYQTQSYLMMAIFLGGLVSGLPAGWIADRYSPRIIIFVCLILSLVGTVFIPLATTVGGAGGIWLVGTLRFIAGVGGQAAIYPCITALCTRWIPPPERSTVIALYTSGIQIASIIGFPLNSFLCTKSFCGGWPAIFYVNSGFVVVCALMWYFIVTNNPDRHKRISQKERDYIHNSLRGQGLKRQSIAMTMTKTPWRYILFSPLMIVNIISAFLGGTLVVVLTVYMPTYFKDVTHVNVEENGMYTALPFICEWVSKMLFAVIADWMKTRTRISQTWICKGFNTIGMAVPAVFLLLSAYADCNNKALPVLYICLATFFSSGTIPGFFTSLVCIAPQYTGIVNSVARFSGQISAVITPLAIGNIVKRGTPSEWKIVFIAVAVMLFAATLLFVIFGSADIQPWAVVKIPESESGKEKGSRRAHHARREHHDDGDTEDGKKSHHDKEKETNGAVYSVNQPTIKFADDYVAEPPKTDDTPEDDVVKF